MAAAIAIVATIAVAIAGANALAQSRSVGASPSAPGQGEQVDPSDAASDPPGSGQADRTFVGGRLEPGRYKTTVFAPGIVFDIPFAVDGLLELPNALVVGMADDPLRADASDSTNGTRLTLFRPTVGVRSCDVVGAEIDDAALEPVPSDRDSLVAWLRSQDGFVLDGLAVVDMKGGDGLRFDVRAEETCTGAASAAKPLFVLDSGDHPVNYLIRPGERARLYVLELAGRAAILAVNAAPDDFEDFDRLARAIAFSLEPSSTP